MAHGRLLVPAVAVALAASFTSMLGPGHSASAAGLSGPLSVSGAQLVDAAGAAVRLEGVVRSGFDGTAWPQAIGPTELQQMASWHVNVVRLPLAMDFWNQDCPTKKSSYNPGYRNAVDAAVQAITGQGMLAVLDLKVSTRFECDTQSTYALPGATEAAAFWSSVAARYAGDPLVAFELYDSPDVCASTAPAAGITQVSGDCASPRNVPADETLWRDGGVVVDGFPTTVAMQVAGMATMYADVAAALPAGAPSHLILVDANGQGSDAHSFDAHDGSYSMFSGRDLVYGQHVMPCTGVWTECPSHDAYYSCATVSAELDGFMTPDVRQHPALVDQFGWPDRSWGLLAQHLVDHLDDSGAPSYGRGFVAFDWDSGARLNPFDLRLSTTVGPGDAAPSGLPVKNAMSGIYANTCPGPAPTYPQALVGPFTVVGNQIHDAAGRQVILKGVNWDGLQNTNWQTAPPLESAIDHLAQWGGNFLRLELDDDEWNQDCPGRSYDTEYRPLADRVVDWASARGILTLVDLHTVARVQCDNQLASRPLPGAEAQPFWASVAAHYAANPLVAYEIYNEPHVCAAAEATTVGLNEFLRSGGGTTAALCSTKGPSAADEKLWAGGGVTDDGIAYPGAGMATLYQTIESHIPAGSPPHLVFVDSNDYSSDNRSFSPSFNGYSMFGGADLVYVEHIYTCSGTPPDSACTSVAANSTCSTVSGIIDNYNAAAWMSQHPVVADEFGWPDSTEGTYTANVVSHLNARGLGFASYTWAGNPWQGQEGLPGFLELTDNVVGADDAAPSGQPIKDAMSGVYPVSC